VGMLLSLASYILFSLARAQRALGGSVLLYWVLKLAYLYPALIASLGWTTLREEWLVSRRVRSEDAQPSCYGSVLRANLAMPLLVGAAAVAALPKRLAAPDRPLTPQGAAVIVERRHADRGGDLLAVQRCVA
jgi:hypothetical protein